MLLSFIKFLNKFLCNCVAPKHVQYGHAADKNADHFDAPSQTKPLVICLVIELFTFQTPDYNCIANDGV